MIIGILSLLSSDCFDDMERVSPHDGWDRAKISPGPHAQSSREKLVHMIGINAFCMINESEFVQALIVPPIIYAKKSAMVTSCLSIV